MKWVLSGTILSSVIPMDTFVFWINDVRIDIFLPDLSIESIRNMERKEKQYEKKKEESFRCWQFPVSLLPSGTCTFIPYVIIGFYY